MEQHRLTKSTGVRIVRPGYTLTHETGTLIESPFERMMRGASALPSIDSSERAGLQLDSQLGWRSLLDGRQTQQLVEFDGLLEELKRLTRDRTRATQLEKMLGL